MLSFTFVAFLALLRASSTHPLFGHLADSYGSGDMLFYETSTTTSLDLEFHPTSYRSLHEFNNYKRQNDGCCGMSLPPLPPLPSWPAAPSYPPAPPYPPLPSYPPLPAQTYSFPPYPSNPPYPSPAAYPAYPPFPAYPACGAAPEPTTT